MVVMLRLGSMDVKRIEEGSQSHTGLRKKKAGVPDVQHCFGAKGLFSFNGAHSFLAIAFLFLLGG